MLRLAVAGASGRMGQRILDLAAKDARFVVVAALTEDIDPRVGQPALPGEASSDPSVPRSLGKEDLCLTSVLDVDCDVYIDFTLPAGTMAGLEACLKRRCPMVIGTTGHDADQRARISAAAATVPIVKASNFSIGVNTLLGVVGRLAAQLGEAYDIEIVEAHHRNKVDAPSGTALALLDEMLRTTGRTRDANVVHGRQGHTGARPPGQIGVHAVRMGDVVGDHAVYFAGPGETLSLRHTALSRDTFAAGALQAAAWLAGRPPGLYSMRDVLTLQGDAS